MTNPEQILTKASSILLVDWSNTGVPRTLIQSGYKVFCFSPNGYTEGSIVSDSPKDLDQNHIFPPASPEENGFLVLRPLSHPPTSIDIVCIYRPANEHAGIISNQVRPYGARAIWLQPPIESEETKLLSMQLGLIFIQGKDIRDVAQSLQRKMAG